MRMNITRTMLVLLPLLVTPLVSTAWERGKVETFATLPAGEAHPEGIIVDREGNVYVTTVGVDKPPTSEGTLVVFDRKGRHLRTVRIKGSGRSLLDMEFHPRTGKLLVADYIAGKVLSVDTKTGDSSVFMTVTGVNPGLNSITFDAADNAYVTDSHQGIIWKVGPDGGEASAWVTSPLLKPRAGAIGANGVVFNNKKTAMFVANTANDTIVKIPLTGATLEPGTPEVFVNRIGGGPDGLHIDKRDNIWVACNQSDEIVVLEPTQGRVIAKLGDFAGIDRNGAPKGLLWPNTFAVHGDDILVTNLSMDLGTMAKQLAEELGMQHLKNVNLRTIDGPWARQVKVHTISKLKMRIPESADLLGSTK